MGIDFNSKNTLDTENSQPENVGTALVNDEQTEIVPFDITKERVSLQKQFVNSPEVDALASTIEIYNLDSIVTFGSKSAEEISKASDAVLNNMSLDKIEKSSEMLAAIGTIMSKFDIDEIENDHDGFFSKMFNNAKKQLDKVLSKYTTMGSEVDKIYVELKQYEVEIKTSNKTLNTIFESNVAYYHDLVKYILAGEQGIRELQEYIAKKQNELSKTQDNAIQFELQTLENALLTLEQRVQDLRIAENVALQSIPMIKTMEFSNANLIRKINSTFIITLPIFKQALAQAIMLKRQKVQSDAMKALDDKTNELLIRNAKNTVEQSKLTTQLASGSSIKVETLETTWRTIVDGINETKTLQEDLRRQREDDAKRLEAIKTEFFDQYSK